MRALLAQWRVELTLTMRRGEGVLITMVVPIVLLVFFAAVLPPPNTGGSALDFLVPGILALAVMSASMVSLGISTAFERFYGVLKRLIGSPLPRATLLLAKTLSVLTIEIVQAAIIVGIARFGFGWEPRGSVPFAILVLLVGSVGFAGIGLLMAGTLRAEGTLAAANGLYLVFLLLGGFIFPLGQLPYGLAGLAQILPAAALADATRSALSGSVADAYLPLGLLVGWTIVSAAAAALTFKAE